MGGASSTQRGGKATQSQTILLESTNANTPKNIAQAANIAKNNQASLNVEQDTKKGSAVATDDVTTAILSNSPTKPLLSSTFRKQCPWRDPGVRQYGFPDRAPPTLQVVSSQPTKDGPTFDQGRKVLGRIDIKDTNVGTQGEKRTRRGRGKRKGKVTSSGAARDGTENVPPPANQLSRRRRARGTGYVDNGTRPAPRRGRATNRVGGAETTNVGNYVASQAVEAFEDVKTTGRHAHVDKAWEHGRSGSDAGGPKHRGRRRLASQGDSRKKPEPAGRGFIPSELEGVEIPKTGRDTASKTAGGLASDEDHRRSGVSHCGETEFPEPTAAGNVSTVHPLPSSTRRRAKEYFQRRARERSVDAVGRRARPPHGHISPVEQEMKSSAQNLGPKENASVTANRPGSIINERRDQFVFDPEASPFTPNATSSPRQASLSSIGVQSFSSPTPLPSHGSSQAQAHIQAEQIALMRLQAYYNWLAGSIPPTTTGVGIANHESEHMEMSGGGGGLSGGVALGRHTRIQGLGPGKGQCRNANSAYSHPKEHVIFSPRDHERTEIGSQSVLHKGIVQSGKGEIEKEAEGTYEGEEARKKWDGKWGLREVGTSGKEIGWSWGRKGTSV
ncbi:hypothetical protein BGY98DRAFT_1098205 [Russula aff. rugulosa BPL654]|nr:hypothetical protein BGY98DRAFT_1098205 [Russula aff. rugulosa BPL654]